MQNLVTHLSIFICLMLIFTIVISALFSYTLYDLALRNKNNRYKET